MKQENTEIETQEETTQETPQETQATENAVQYEIVDGDLDGVKVRGIRANGNVLFTVSEGFSDEHVQEVFNIANRFFNEGVQFGGGQVAARYLQFHEGMKSLIPKQPDKPADETEDETGGNAEVD